MKKILLTFLVLSLISSVMALDIQINSVGLKNRDNLPVADFGYMGDQMVVNMSVIDTSCPIGTFCIKQARIIWGSSYVDCSFKSAELNKFNYLCTMTVTPSMNGNQEVNIYSLSSTSESQKSLGVFDFKGLLIRGIFNPTKYVNFNGQFSQGAVLYSDTIYVKGFIGKDAYPIELCTLNYTCLSYKYHYEKDCLAYTMNNRCKKYRYEKVFDDCKKYGYRKTCMKTPLCVNPSKSTNALSLENFYYSTDGVNWQNVPYGQKIINSNVKFKVVIPSVCYPNFDINHSIKYQ